MKYVTNAEQIGIQKGLEQGREQTTREIAQSLLEQGVPVKTIAIATNLTIEQIQQLQISLSESSEN